MTDKKPTVAITIGDPAGIGPEIALKAVQSNELRELSDLLIIGSKDLLLEQCRLFCTPELLSSLSSPSSNLRIIDVPMPEGPPPQFGQISAASGAVSYEYLKAAIALGKEREIDAIVTAPVHKESWRAGGVPHVGHTEALAELFDSGAETLFVVDDLRIFFLTRHVSLREAIDLITADRMLFLLRHARQALGWFGINQPRIAVAGLNPHAGDGGLFGDEEIKILAPAVKEARKEGIDAFGPLPADSVFHQCAEGQFDAVIALYHDQGHIAAKMRSFLGTVSVTTGLPVIRTSVDHGTAFDIAGKNQADPSSMVAAIKLAVNLSKETIL